MMLDYKGGTYISQVTAQSPEAAIEEWVAAANERDLSNWALTRVEMTQLFENRPIPIENCLNVWCVSDLTSRGMMLLNIVATVAT
jgi:hypothetical protein